MNRETIIIRHEKTEQYHEMESLVRDAFWDKYTPGCREHLLVHRLRKSSVLHPELCFAAEYGGELAGGIWYADASLKTQNGIVTVLTMGPVAVAPRFQKHGIGSVLIRSTLELAEKSAAPAVLIYGDPGYYSRFGFEPAEKYGITDAEGGYCPALLIRAFSVVPAGAFSEGEIYCVSAEEADLFDRNFPSRQKHVLPTQLF